jgi:hypothetical protein
LWVEESIVAITELPPSRQGVASSHGLILAASAQRHTRATAFAGQPPRVPTPEPL